MGLLLFFIDGIGVQKNRFVSNGIEELFGGLMGPFTLSDLEPGTPVYFSGGGATAVDAVLGVSGLPQSATGQASIFTGINAQKFLGFHQTALPDRKLAALVLEKSLLKELKHRGYAVTSANLYSRQFFESRRHARKNRFPVSTLSIAAADIPFRFYDDYLRDKTVFADISNTLLKKRGMDIPEISPAKAASNMLNILARYDFVFFEYFMTDLYGHKRDAEALRIEVAKINSFLGAILEPGGHDVLIVSDHGNAEDLSVADHTFNKVPVILFGDSRRRQQDFLEGLDGIDRIYERVLAYYENRGK
ncbi:MAG: hypothetical protein JW874_00485 [Spirochaetales bacterium]|nr:hypothetical protein [Spirochaetales bacterium]